MEWSYRIHRRVNQKLFWQQVRQAGDNVDSLLAKWWNYEPGGAASVRCIRPDDGVWWFHLFTFVYYIVCDFEAGGRGQAIAAFLPQVGNLLETMHYGEGVRLTHAVTHIRVPADFADTLAARITYVTNIQRATGNVDNTAVCDPAEMTSICSESIVGCSADDKNQVGC